MHVIDFIYGVQSAIVHIADAFNAFSHVLVGLPYPPVPPC